MSPTRAPLSQQPAQQQPRSLPHQPQSQQPSSSQRLSSRQSYHPRQSSSYQPRAWRVGIDCRMYDTGFTGIGRYVANLVAELVKLGGPYHYVLFFHRGQVPEKLAASLSPTSYSPTSYEIVEVNAPYYSWAEQLGYPAELRRRQLDLMHFTHFNAPLLYHGPQIVTIHDLTLSRFPSHKRNHPWHRAAYQLALRSVVRKAIQVIAVSEHTKQDLIRMLNVPTEKITAIPEAPAAVFSVPISPDQIQQVQEHYQTGPEYLLYTGVWRPHKNLVRLVEAFAQLKKENWPQLKLVMAGKEDAAYPEVRERVQALGLAGEVRMPGFIPDADLPALVKGARIYVFPSLYEGFGLPPLEAMACGTPVCVARSSSLPEVCGEGNAHYFDPLSVDDIALTLAELLRSQALQTTYRERGPKWAARFSWERLAKETRVVYDEVLRRVATGVW